MAAAVTLYSYEDFFGELLDIADMNATLQADLQSAQCIIPLDITAFREIATNAVQNLAAHGGIMAVDSTPTLSRVNGATDRALRLTWVANDVAEVACPPIPWPPDLDPAENVVVHLLLARSGTTNGIQIDVLAYENGAGAYGADTEMGGKITALSSAANLVVESTVTLSASDIAGSPGVLNLSLLPDAHDTDSIYLYGAWIEYTRALRTS